MNVHCLNLPRKNKTVSDKITRELSKLYQSHFGTAPEKVALLPASGSARRYYRLEHAEASAIGTYGSDEAENRAFFYFTEHFLKSGIHVPQILIKSEDHCHYLQEDLGDQSLLSHLKAAASPEDPFPAVIEQRYGEILGELLQMQIEASKEMDFDRCYPERSFDRTGILKDLRYFKSYFLHVSEIPYSERAIEADFERLATHCLSAKSDYFMYRDFQSRNIMIKDKQNVYIDYQGGRQGPLAYDVVSLLFQARAALPTEAKQRLLDSYLQQASKQYGIDAANVGETFNSFVWVRVLQTLGAYGFRGIIQRKDHFLLSIPPALQNLQSLLEQYPSNAKLEVLPDILKRLLDSDWCNQFRSKQDQESPLLVSIKSFSYKRALPTDPSGNGGGFIFDCRHLNNPGRHDQYKQLTGKDLSVQVFLDTRSKLPEFLRDVFSTVDRAVDRYIERGFEHLQVSFGCTGGRHRSVYSAERLKTHLLNKYCIKVDVQHIEREIEAQGC